MCCCLRTAVFALENGALHIQEAEDKLKTLALPPNSIE